MSGQRWSKAEARQIVKRVIVEGDLVLQTPAHLGNGDGDDVSDMPLLVDAVDGKSPLLTGASIAGALRSYLRSREAAYGQAATADASSVLLFGGLKEDPEGGQSPLIVEDARGTVPSEPDPLDPKKKKRLGAEVRDGVRIDGASRTAAENALYDVQLWRAGTTFTVRGELLIRAGDDEAQLKQALKAALTGLIDGGITLGARKRRGYGRVTVTQWRQREFDLLKPAALCAWIKDGNNALQPAQAMARLEKLSDAAFADLREMFEIEAEFTLPGSLLIRSGGGRDDTGPDMVHLKSYRPESQAEVAILSGTSLAGALRARALKIANTIKPQQAATKVIDSLFGTTAQASRVIVEEQEIMKARVDLVQSRVSIDRFTGGARDTALFNEQPALGGTETTLKMKVRLMQPQEHEVGLLLLLLKDLWTSDLPLGGESSVGRGRLIGRWADLTWRNGQIRAWRIEEENHDQPGKLIVTKKHSEPQGAPRSELDQFVEKLWKYQPEVQHGAQ